MRVRATVLGLCGMLSGAVLTEESVGRIEGKVVDQSGAALPGASVVANGDTGSRSTSTDAVGAYRLLGLAPGRYTVTARLQGFQATSRKVTVGAGRAATANFVLNVGGMTETVSVSGEAPGIHSSSAMTVLEVAAPWRVQRGSFNTTSFDKIDENPFLRAEKNPLSTFSADVDTASYAIVRRALAGGALPPKDAVRIEELVNYFRFDYPEPSGEVPFSLTAEVGECPWVPEHRLAAIGLKARALPKRETPPRNLVFLLDVSGSMQPDDRLPLVRSAMALLVNELTARDSVAIVVYAGSSGLVLPATRGDRKDVIQEALSRLEAGGSTNGAQGIELAYAVARENFVEGGVNRVILATDGDFNVGVTSPGDLVRLIEDKRKTGIFLSVLGVGDDNLKDSTMKKLADHGNGNYAYLDSLQEAHKVLVREAGSTLVTVAKDVKLQVEFNPARVSAYRLIGYENRLLRSEDFKDDKKDAGEIGAGHTVTALYEIVPSGKASPAGDVDELRYQQPRKRTAAASGPELLTVKVRYKAPEGETSQPLAMPVVDPGRGPMPQNLGFAAAVVEFGLLLRESEHKGAASYANTAALARRFKGDDAEGYRSQFVELVEIAQGLARVKAARSR